MQYILLSSVGLFTRKMEGRLLNWPLVQRKVCTKCKMILPHYFKTTRLLCHLYGKIHAITRSMSSESKWCGGASGIVFQSRHVVEEYLASFHNSKSAVPCLRRSNRLWRLPARSALDLPAKAP